MEFLSNFKNNPSFKKAARFTAVALVAATSVGCFQKEQNVPAETKLAFPIPTPVVVTPFKFEPSLSDIETQIPYQIPLIAVTISNPYTYLGVFEGPTFPMNCPEGTNSFRMENYNSLGERVPGIGVVGNSGGYKQGSQARLYISSFEYGPGIYSGYITQDCRNLENDESLAQTRINYLIEYKEQPDKSHLHYRARKTPYSNTK